MRSQAVDQVIFPKNGKYYPITSEVTETHRVNISLPKVSLLDIRIETRTSHNASIIKKLYYFVSIQKSKILQSKNQKKVLKYNKYKVLKLRCYNFFLTLMNLFKLCAPDAVLFFQFDLAFIWNSGVNAIQKNTFQLLIMNSK